jgi:hypothetical protein
MAKKAGDRRGLCRAQSGTRSIPAWLLDHVRVRTCWGFAFRGSADVDQLARMQQPPSGLEIAPSRAGRWCRNPSAAPVRRWSSDQGARRAESIGSRHEEGFLKVGSAKIIVASVRLSLSLSVVQDLVPRLSSRVPLPLASLLAHLFPHMCFLSGAVSSPFFLTISPCSPGSLAGQLPEYPGAVGGG